MNRNTGECRVVYLLQPGGKPPIEELSYEGYGEFGGVDAHVWLSTKNISSEFLAKFDERDVRSLGICLVDGNYYIDAETGKKWDFHFNRFVSDIHDFGGLYNEPIIEIGQTPNDLISAGRFIPRPYTDYLGEIKLPLKFSFNPDACYEDLPASADCPRQGFFDFDTSE